MATRAPNSSSLLGATTVTHHETVTTHAGFRLKSLFDGREFKNDESKLDYTDDLNILHSCRGGLRPRSEPQSSYREFHKIAYADPNTLWRNRWLGISALQNPNDAWIIQEIIAEVKPDYIIEAGTYMGGSAVLWAMILREINPAGKVIAIDIQDRSAEARKLDIAQKDDYLYDRVVRLIQDRFGDRSASSG